MTNPTETRAVLSRYCHGGKLARGASKGQAHTHLYQPGAPKTVCRRIYAENLAGREKALAAAAPTCPDCVKILARGHRAAEVAL